MRTLRAIYRLLLILLVTGVLTTIWLVRIPFLGKKGRLQWRGVMVQFWANTVLPIMKVRVNVEGAPPVPPFCLVSNHLSYLDIILFQSLMPCVFVAKSEVANWPVIGWLARAIGTRFIVRSKRSDVVRVNAEVEQSLLDGEGVIIFPEGTSSKGDGILPFKSAILGSVINVGQPVAYASVSYRTPEKERPAHLAVCWWGDMTFADHFFNVLKLPTFDALVVFGDESVEVTDRKKMARTLEEKIASTFVPVV